MRAKQFTAFCLRLFLLFAVICGHLSTSLADATTVDIRQRMEEDRRAADKLLSTPKMLNKISIANKDIWQNMKTQASGNGGWGGGHSVRRFPNEKPILLDFFTANPEFTDTRFNNTPLIETDFMKYNGTQPIRVQDLAAYAEAKRILEAWRPNNQGLINMILLALDKVNVQYIWRSVPLAGAETYFLPTELRHRYLEGVMTPVVAYFRSEGLIIAAPEWNQMGDLSQAGLLIHEALRRVQISYDLIVSPQKLQLLTATLALHSPSEGLELESATYLDQKLLQEIRRVSTWKIAPGSAHENICRASFTFPNSPKPAMIGADSQFIVSSVCEKMAESRKLTDQYVDFKDVAPSVRSFFDKHCDPKAKKLKETPLTAVEAVLNAEKFHKKVQLKFIEKQKIYGQMPFALDDARMDLIIFLMELPWISSQAVDLKQISQQWTQWKQAHCSASALALTSANLVEATRFAYAANEENKNLISELSEAFASLDDHELKMSLADRLEEELTAERERTKNDYHDDLTEKIITGHVEGKVFVFNWPPVLQYLRASEEYLRQNSKPEVVRFRDEGRP